MTRARPPANVVRSPRLVARRREVRAARVRRRRRVLAGTLVLAALGGGAYAFAQSSLFKLSRIEVVGERAISEVRVIEASGLRIGENLIGFDGEAVESRVRRLGLVRSVVVSRVGQTGVRIKIAERRPAVEVRTHRGRWYLDEDGKPFAGPATRARLPIIRIPPPPKPPASAAPAAGAPSPSPVPSPEVAQAEPKQTVTPAVGRGVVAVWRALPPAVQRDVRWFEAPRASEISMRLGEVDVLIGFPEQLDEKIDALALVLARIEADDSTPVRIDVRSPRRPAATIR